MKKDFKYGSPEYRIEEAKESLEGALKGIEKFRTNVSEQKEIERIKVTQKLKNTESYFNQSRYNNYISFDNTDKEHIQKCYVEKSKHIQELEEIAQKTHDSNSENIKYNQEIVQSIKNFMSLVGINETYQSYELPSTRHRNKKWVKKRAGYLDDISRVIITTDNFTNEMNQLKTYRGYLEEWYKKTMDKVVEMEKFKKEEDEKLRKLASAVELSKIYNISETDYGTNEELFGCINEVAREEYIKENYPDGTEMNIKCCSECSEWEIGEHRCSCGNRRMYLDVYGDFFEGFEAYAAAD